MPTGSALSPHSLGPIASAGSQMLRKFRSSWKPASVSTDSGWNCTPSTLSFRWRRPMIVPSAVSAEISSVLRQRFPFDDQRVVARGGKILRQIAKHRLAVMMNFTGLAVHHVRCSDYAPSERRADRLMP